MKQLITLVLLTLILMMSVQNTYAGEAADIFTAEQVDWINKNKTLTIGYPLFDFPPYIVYLSSEEVGGIYQDYVKQFENLTGIDVKVKLFNNTETLIEALENGQIDFIAGISDSLSQRANFDFSESFLSVPQAVVILGENVGSDTQESIENLHDYKFVSEKGFSSETTLLNALPKANWLGVDNALEAIAAVKYGLADAYFTDEITANYLANSESPTNLKVINLTDVEFDENKFIFAKNRDVLASVLNKVIDNIGSVTEHVIVSRWNMKESTHKNVRLSLTLLPTEQQWLDENPIISFSSSKKLNLISSSGGDEELPSGFSVDVLSLVAKKLGVTLKYVEADSRENAIEMLESGEVSILPFTIASQYIDFDLLHSKPYMSASWVLLSTPEQKESISKLGHVRAIANPLNYFDKNYIQRFYPEAQVIAAEDMADALKMLDSGKVEGVFSLLSQTLPYYQGVYTGDYKIIQQLESKDALAISMAVDRGNETFQNIINKALADISDEEIETIRSRWFHIDINHGIDLDKYSLPLGVIIVILCFLFFSFAFWNRRLQAQIDIRKTTEKRALTAEKAAIENAKSQSEFLARMSHEIRTPMSGVLGMTEALEFTELSEHQQDLVKTLQGSAKNLMSLLNDVLDFSKLDAGKITLEQTPFIMEDVLLSSIDNYRHKAKSAQLTLSYQLDNIQNYVFIGDQSRLTQVINNLVSNSIKFTPSGFVELSASMIDKNENKLTVRIDVRDSGIGISKNNVNKLFQAFTQAESATTRKYGGTGLGLAICKEIIEAMQGKISFESVENVGSLFSIEVPLEILPAETPVSYKQQGGNEGLVCKSQIDLSNLSILFAEDNAVNRKVISGQFSRLGIDVDIVENGQLGIERYETGDYDIIVSDCHMPIVDGFGLATHISAKRKGIRPYLIALTADALNGSAQKCRDAGFDDYISKPCPQEQLAQKLAFAKHALEPSDDLSTILENWQCKIEIPKDTALIEQVNNDDSLSLSTQFEEHSVIPTEQLNKLNRPSESIDTDEKNSQSLFDLAHLLMLSGDDTDSTAEILTLFLSVNNQDQKSVTRSVESHDAEQLKSVVHRIKGSIQYLSKGGVINQAQYIEDHASSNISTPEFQQKVKEFCLNLSQLRTEVEMWLANGATKEGISHESV